MSYTIPPKTDLEEIASWIALKGKDPNFTPSENELWRIYSNRKSIEIKGKQLFELVKFNLKQRIPVFYWIENIKNNELKNLLIDSISEVRDFQSKSNILKVSAFLGKKFYSKMLSKFTNTEFKRLSKSSQKFPSSGPRELFQEKQIEYKKRSMKIGSDKDFEQKLLEELNEVSTRLSSGDGEAYDKYLAISIDCFCMLETTYINKL